MATGAPEFKPTENPASFADSLLTRVSLKVERESLYLLCNLFIVQLDQEKHP